ncbi:hypothetical protein DY000_02017822 [Brassica cretica]|uniref:DUF4283 domain-containing protein n=1 Tax=Brassica cretica TaxID=69181 RepID=A0ABQ7D3J4_BRACR|nr:hypothetical protein DY000_02017822 [Brassica cretica]
MNSAAPPGSPASPEADLRGEARDEGSTVGMARLVADSKKVVPTSPEADLRGEARDEGSTVGMARLVADLKKVVPSWRVPLHMFSWESLSFITSEVGSPVKLHMETLACSNFEVAKVFVNVDVSKPLPKEINFSKNGKEFKVDFHFPWLPTRCKLCNKWGHSEKVCVLKGKDKVHDSPPTVPMEEAKKGLETALSQNGNIGEVATPVAEDVETVVAEDVAEDVELDGINKEEVLAENMETVVAEEELELNASKNGELVTKIGENEVLGETNKLLLVSSSKVGRSPVRFTLKNQTPDFQISGSKFSVLSNDEEEEGEITGDGLQNLAVAETLVNNDSVNAEEDDGVNTTSNHAEEKAKETHMKGATKEKKAKETAQLPSYDTCILGLD